MGSRDEPNPWRYTGLGMELVGAAIILGIIGWYIDRQYDSEPWGVLIGGSVGFIGGFYLFIKEALKANRPNSKPSESTRQDDEHP